MSENITSHVYWAAVSPLTHKGMRWIAHSTVASTKRDSRALFVHPFRNATNGAAEWSHWRKQGWTIERVCLGPVPEATP